LLVPGGTFKRDFDGIDFADDRFVAEISPFYLDKFEVTVGRMKQFVAAYSNINLKSGDGKSEHIADDSGWSTAYDLPLDVQALTEMLRCEGTSWSDLEENIRVPINCVSFNVSYAFCIWDGGRLPTEAEWNFAAAGGSEQRTFPWVGLEVTEEHAFFGAAEDTIPTSVGLTPKGNGRWGNSDLSGNVSEWVLDYYYPDYPELCKDCFAWGAAPSRTIRGAPYTTPADYQVVPYRGDATDPLKLIGFRCARDMKIVE
jgi:formylglycine-generating enzyme required for sulfatase activity